MGLFCFQNFDQFCVMVDKSVKVNVAESMARRQWSTEEFSTVLATHTEMVSYTETEAVIVGSNVLAGQSQYDILVFNHFLSVNSRFLSSAGLLQSSFQCNKNYFERCYLYIHGIFLFE